jgi:bacterial/archaeal transporter family-2 protein
MLIPQIGAATTVALTVTGQQLAAAVIDSYGLSASPGAHFPAPELRGSSCWLPDGC